MNSYEFFDTDLENQAELHEKKRIELQIVDKIFLFAIIMSPILVVILFFWKLNEAILTIFCFHFISLIAFPLFFINFLLTSYQSSETTYDIRFFLNETNKNRTNIKNQLFYGLFFMLGILSVGSLAFFLLLKIVYFYFFYFVRKNIEFFFCLDSWVHL